MSFGRPGDEKLGFVFGTTIVEIERMFIIQGWLEKLKGRLSAAVNFWYCLFHDCVGASRLVQISCCVCWASKWGLVQELEPGWSLC